MDVGVVSGIDAGLEFHCRTEGNVPEERTILVLVPIPIALLMRHHVPHPIGQRLSLDALLKVIVDLSNSARVPVMSHLVVVVLETANGFDLSGIVGRRRARVHGAHGVEGRQI